MKYRVDVTDSAAEEIVDSFAFIRKRSPLNAEQWLRDIYNAIEGLGEFAGYGRAPESDYLDADLRQKVFKPYRIIFSIDKPRKVVTIHFVRHGSRRSVGEPEGDDE